MVEIERWIGAYRENVNKENEKEKSNLYFVYVRKRYGLIDRYTEKMKKKET